MSINLDVNSVGRMSFLKYQLEYLILSELEGKLELRKNIRGIKAGRKSARSFFRFFRKNWQG